MLSYQGSIEDVLRSGEYDSGDVVVLDYDELFDLVEQAKILKRWALNGYTAQQDEGTVLAELERITNRPLHPVLGGKSPYSEFLGI